MSNGYQGEESCLLGIFLECEDLSKLGWTLRPKVFHFLSISKLDKLLARSRIDQPKRIWMQSLSVA